MAAETAALEALESWARDRYGLRWPLRAQVLKLIKSHQGRPEAPTAFVGRAAVMQQLDQWLLQAQRRLLLVSGAAGRGKSALLLHWLGRLIQRDSGITPIYLPISIRFNTADETCGVQLLFAALCDVFSDLKQQIPQQPEMQDYIDGIARAWQQVELRSGQAFLLVVDGLDEAIHRWFIERQLLPRELPPNLHVLIAARHKPGHADGMAWLEDLGSDASENQVLEICTLEPEAMAEALIQLGHPLDRLTERQAFTEHLHRLTDGGEPLLLTLWLGQIWRQRDQLPDLDCAALAQLQPGFGDLYILWMNEQASLWSAMGLELRPQDFKQVMHVLAVAQGRLLLQDLVELLGYLGSASWEPRQLGAALETAHRLIVGDDTGYVLVHPRLAQHIEEQLEADREERDAVHGAFLKWGASTVRRLNSLDLKPEECPAYLLTHYVAVHLEAGEGSDPRTIEEYALPLLRQGWAQAWYAREGSWQGYLNDLQQLARRVQAFNQGRVRAGQAPSLAIEVRSALLAASIRSLIGNLPPALLLHLACQGVWSLARATRAARQYEPTGRARCLTELAAVAAVKGEPAEAASLLQEALDAAEAIEPQSDRVDAFSAVAAQLRGEARRTVLQRAIEVAATDPHQWQRASDLIDLAPHLHGDGALLQQALEVAAAIADGHQRVRAVSAVAAQLPQEGRQTVLEQALQAATSIQDASSRGSALTRLATQLQGQAQHTALKLALDAARENPSEWSDATGLISTAAEADTVLLQQAIEVAGLSRAEANAPALWSWQQRTSRGLPSARSLRRHWRPLRGFRRGNASICFAW